MFHNLVNEDNGWLIFLSEEYKYKNIKSEETHCNFPSIETQSLIYCTNFICIPIQVIYNYRLIIWDKFKINVGALNNKLHKIHLFSMILPMGGCGIGKDYIVNCSILQIK